MLGRAAAKLSHEGFVLAIHAITTTNPSAGAGTIAVAPTSAALAVGTITSHVTSVTADTTDDVGCEVALFGTIVLAVTDLTAVLASLVLIVTQGTVESSQLTQLVALELVLAFGDRSSLESVSLHFRFERTGVLAYSFDDVVNQLLGLVDLLLGVGHDQAVKILLLVAGVSGIGASLALLDGALATDGNLGTRLGLHLLQGVSTGSDE